MKKTCEITIYDAKDLDEFVETLQIMLDDYADNNGINAKNITISLK